MEKLEALLRALQSLRQSGSCGKVFFYSEPSAGGMRHGHVAVHAEGRCLIDFEGRSLDQAIEALMQTPIGRVVLLSNAGLGPAPSTARTLALTGLIDRLRGAAGVEPIATAGAPAESGAQSAAVVAADASANARVRAEPGDAPTSDGTSMVGAIALVGAVVAVLEEYFGGAAAARVDQLTDRFPPDRQPAAFLAAAEQQLAALVGPGASARAFDGVRKRLGLR